MSRNFSKLAITAGAATLAFTPIAASAGTRAGDDASVYSDSVSQPGQGRAATGESVGGGFSFASILIGIYVGAWTTLFITEVTEDDKHKHKFQSAGV